MTHHEPIAPGNHREEVQSDCFEVNAMSEHLHLVPPPNAPPTGEQLRPFHAELPMTVKDAAKFLGVSSQTVYLWVERKQIPHLRVMGRNIRFLKSDLEPSRAQFKQEVENGTTKQA